MKQTNTMNIPKVYRPQQVEERWYRYWVEQGYFNAEVRPDKAPYTIVIPPPNVTAALHMGHAFNNTIQDILIRYKRKQGYEALYLPGTDHAGIATQNVVEKELRKENLTRHDLGREKFVQRVWQWKEKYGNTIINQLKKMGCSCDWRRERFTMDSAYSYAVREVFIRLYRKGWIYRGKYIINWCPRCSTALSDEEVEHRQVDGHLWHVKYPLKDGSGHVVVATTRPETMLGDTAVAVHPDDERYQPFIGKTLVLPLMNREIPIVADPQVDPEFGTGAVKVTPAHDPNDFQIAQRHQLPAITIMDEAGVLNENAGDFKGLDRFVGRKRVVEALEEQGFLVKVEKHVHNVGHCHRCGTVVEPYLSEQWFVRMKEMARRAMDVVKEGKIQFHPAERWLKTYYNWLENVRDWCISRQLWWGHRIPVFYCDACGHQMVDHHMPSRCEKCSSTRLHQDEDVLDTWFSSWLWPFATLGWPEQTPELQYFYPTNTLVTGPDIIFFWVARMIMSGLEFMGEIPFRDVYLNGIVRDAQGRKMSKSLGNGIDPLDIIETYSADAMRFTLIMLSSEGQDINLAESHFEMGRNFSNKIWNAYRFLAMNLDQETGHQYLQYRDHFQLADRWILSRLNHAVKTVASHLDQFRIHDSLEVVYHFFWDEFCDWYLELIKLRLYQNEDPVEKSTARSVAVHVMKTAMQLLHPYMPFITEEIWQRLKRPEEASVVVSEWPRPVPELHDPMAEHDMAFLQQVIGQVRAIRAEMNVPPQAKATLLYRASSEHQASLLESHRDYILQMARLESVSRLRPDHDLHSTASAVVEGVELFVPLADLIDLEVERRRLDREIERLMKQIEASRRKLSNEDFLQKAPAQVVQMEKEKLQNLSEKLVKLQKNRKRLD